jgi:hypothetical protein
MFYYVYDRFAEPMKSRGYPLDGIAMAFLGGVFSSIFCGGRNNRVPALSDDPVRQGGLQFSALMVSLGFAGVFGLVTGVVLRITGDETTDLTDMGAWQIDPEMMPIYPDEPRLERMAIEEKGNVAVGKVVGGKAELEKNDFSLLKERFMTERGKESGAPSRFASARSRTVREKAEFDSPNG